QLLVANEGSSSVSFVEPRSLVETMRVTVGDGPKTILVDSAGRRAYVACSRANRVDVLDIARAALAGSIPADAGPIRCQLDRQETRLFVIQDSSPQLLVVDPRTDVAVRRLFVGPGQAAVKVDRQNDRLYLARSHNGAIEIFDPH